MSRLPPRTTMARGARAPAPPRRAAALVLLTRDDPARVTGGVETFARHLRTVVAQMRVVAYAGAAGRRLLFNEARDARAIRAELGRQIRAGRARVIVANGAAAWAITPGARGGATPMARSGGCRPSVITVYHGTYAGFGAALGRHAPLHALWTRLVGASLERRAGRNADQVVAVSPRVAREASRSYGVRARVIPNAVDVDGYQPIETRVARVRLGLVTDRPIVVFVGRPTWAKGHDLVCRLARRRPGITVLAAGPEPDASLPRNLIALGPVDSTRLREIYAAADALVLPSRYEGCSFVPLEAMAAGRPVIVTDVGLFEQAGRHPFGVVVPVGDGERFIRGVDEVLESRDRFEARRWVAAHHGIDRFAASWRQLIEEVADGR